MCDLDSFSDIDVQAPAAADPCTSSSIHPSWRPVVSRRPRRRRQLGRAAALQLDRSRLHLTCGRALPAAGHAVPDRSHSHIIDCRGPAGVVASGCLVVVLGAVPSPRHALACSNPQHVVCFLAPSLAHTPTDVRSSSSSTNSINLQETRKEIEEK